MKQKLAILYSFEPCLDPKLYFTYITMTNFDITVFGIADYRFPKKDESPENSLQIRRLSKNLSMLILIDFVHFIYAKKLANIGLLLSLFFVCILLLPAFAILYLGIFLARFDYIIYSKLKNIACLKSVVLKSRNIQYFLQFSLMSWLMIKFYGKNLLKSCQLFLIPNLYYFLKICAYARNIFRITSAELSALYKQLYEIDIVYSHDLESLLTGALYKFKKGCILVCNLDALQFNNKLECLNKNTYLLKKIKNIIKISVDVIITSDFKLADQIKNEYQIPVFQCVSELNFQQ